VSQKHVLKICERVPG